MTYRIALAWCGFVLALAALGLAVKSHFQPVESSPASVSSLVEATPIDDVFPSGNTTVATDVFRPGHPSNEPTFRMPGEALPTGPDRDPGHPVVLIGTGVLPDGGGFAMWRIGSEPARLVRVGQHVSGYTLLAVRQGKATLKSERGITIDISAAKAGK